MRRKAVLVLCPSEARGGGVANYFRVLGRHFEEVNASVDYCIVGGRSDHPTILSRFVFSFLDICRVLKLIRKYDVIHINPSLDVKGILRDGFYNTLAKRFFGKKTLVFFRGWDENIADLFEKIGASLFRWIFKADMILVLSSSVKKRLINWGYCPEEIRCETTLVDEQLMERYDINKRIAKIKKERFNKVLFLARLEKEKGIMETLVAVNEVTRNYPDVHLTVAGAGKAMESAKRLAQSLPYIRATFVGYVRGDEKRKALENADIYVLPTFGEGLPNSVLEAMAFGLCVLTTPVGGLADVIEDGKNGFLLKNSEPLMITEGILNILETDKEQIAKVSEAANRLASDRWLSSVVARRLLMIYDQLFV